MSLDLNDLQALEGYFAKHAESTIFPVLADHYYRRKDFEHARGVCEIGLDQHPDSVDGNFILSKVELIDRNLTEAEKLLRRVVAQDPAHVYALRLLMQVQITLERSTNTIRKTVDNILSLYPDDEDARLWEKDHSDDDVEAATEAEPEEETNTPPVRWESSEPPSKDYIKVSARMATFTLADVFKKQENYYQALEILNLVESKGGDRQRVERERAIIKKLMEEQETTDDEYSESN